MGGGGNAFKTVEKQLLTPETYALPTNMTHMTYMKDHRTYMVFKNKAYVTLDMTNLCSFMQIVIDGKNINSKSDEE